MQNVASFLSFFGGFLNACSESLFRNEVKGVFFMENNKKIKPNSYYSIQYWMINELGLKGLDFRVIIVVHLQAVVVIWQILQIQLKLVWIKP